MTRPSAISQNLERVRAKIAAACAKSGRAATDVSLVAVSKTKPIELIKDAFSAGQKSFGENYVQEAVEKARALPAADWHLIGSLQSNKAKLVVGRFALIHSVDRLKLATMLDEAAKAQNVRQRCLMQVHIGNEETKHGFALSEAPEAAAAIAAMANLELCGLMSLPPLEETEEKSRAGFAALRKCLEDCRERLALPDRGNFRQLSMGTSADYEWAIAEGATIVRVGTEIFGAR